MSESGGLSREHRAMLAIEALHAFVVLAVVACTTIVYMFRPFGFPQDLLGFVYSSAITYVGGRAAASRGALARRSDNTPPNGNGE